MTLADVPVFVLQLNLKVSPIPTIRLLLLIEILVGSSTTVILQVAVFPLEVFAVMVAVPTDFAVTFPFDTVAILVSLDFQVTVLSVAFVGVIVAVSVSELPFVIVTDVLFKVIPVTSTVGLITVTLQVAVLPLFDFAVMFAVPVETAVTLPPDTVATLLLLVVHITVLIAALGGVVVAVRV